MGKVTSELPYLQLKSVTLERIKQPNQVDTDQMN